MSKIWYPCKTCEFEHTCQADTGCKQWKAWFRAYWRELRRVALKERERSEKNRLDRG